MAEQVSRTGAIHDHWSRVRVRCRAFEVTEIRPVHAWLEDPERPGRWVSGFRLDKPNYIDYYIEDPKVALEFKMRFG